MQIRRIATILRRDFGELSRAAQDAVVAVVAALILLLAASFTVAGPQERLTADNPSPPASTVKLIFIHHFLASRVPSVATPGSGSVACG